MVGAFLLRSSIKIVSYKSIRALMADLKRVYSTLDEQQTGYQNLKSLRISRLRLHPQIADRWRANGVNLSTYIKYPPEASPPIYTTNSSRPITEIIPHETQTAGTVAG